MLLTADQKLKKVGQQWILREDLSTYDQFLLVSNGCIGQQISLCPLAPKPLHEAGSQSVAQNWVFA